MRKTVTGLLLIVVLLSLAGAAFAAYDMTGRWLIEGSGYAEKGAVRVALKDEGTLDIHTKTEGRVQYITGYALKIRLNASKLGINAWENSSTITFQTPIQVPSHNPTSNAPFDLPTIKVDRMTYKIRFTSTTSGTAKIYGFMDIDNVGTVEINSDNIVWKQGSPKPIIDDNMNGCNVGVSLLGLLMGTPLFVLMRRKQKNTL